MCTWLWVSEAPDFGYVDVGDKYNGHVCVTGVRGVIITSDGQPADNVTVQIDDRMPVETTPLGEYWKLLLPGNYTLYVCNNSLRPQLDQV